MVAATSEKSSQKACGLKQKRAARIKGIVADSATLGVGRQHLYKVLRGKRESKPLLARYKALKGGDGK